MRGRSITVGCQCFDGLIIGLIRALKSLFHIFFHSIKFKILICIGALLLGFMAYVAVSAGIETIPERIIGSVTYPFVTASNAISEGVTGRKVVFQNPCNLGTCGVNSHIYIGAEQGCHLGVVGSYSGNS